jgi:orotate phosphoribosyltransferase-like protein
MHTDIKCRDLMFACPRCREREARELERQGLSLSDIAATMNVTLRAVVLLLEASETERQAGSREPDAMETRDRQKPRDLWCRCLHCIEVAMRELQPLGLETGEIAAALGLTRSTVEVLLRPLLASPKPP